MKSLEEIKANLIQLKEVLSRRYGVTEIGIFGSFVRGEQGPDSDLDVLVDFSEIPSLFQIIDLEIFLSDVLGMKVDVVPRECIRPELKESIDSDILTI